MIRFESWELKYDARGEVRYLRIKVLTNVLLYSLVDNNARHEMRRDAYSTHEYSGNSKAPLIPNSGNFFRLPPNSTEHARSQVCKVRGASSGYGFRADDFSFFRWERAMI